MEFKVKSKVKWLSKSAGSEIPRLGVVVEVLAPGQDIAEAHERLVAKYKAISHWGAGGNRPEACYAVLVPGASPKQRPHLYFPRTSQLRPA